jgi:hypothetical protein
MRVTTRWVSTRSPKEAKPRNAVTASTTTGPTRMASASFIAKASKAVLMRTG